MESLWRKAVMFVWQLSVGICLLCSCGEGTGEMSGALDRAEGCMDEDPDSALAILDSIGADTLRLAGMNRADHARYALLLTQARHKNYIDETSDSLITVAVDYYDRHASSEPMRLMLARYYQGVVRSNAHNYASAILSLMKAESLAESLDRPLWLGRSRLAIGDIYRAIFSHVEEMNYAHLACDAFELSGDSANIQYSKVNLATAFCNSNQPDSALTVAKLIYKNAQKSDDSIYMAEGLRLMCNSYMRVKSYDKAVDGFKKLMSLTGSKLSPQNYYLYILALWNSGHTNEALDAIKTSESYYGESAEIPQEILDETGDIKKAFLYQQKQYELLNSAFSDIATQSVSSAVKDYIESDLRNQQILHEKDIIIRWCLSVILMIVVGLIIYIIITYRKRNRLKEIRIMELGREIQSIMSDKKSLANELETLSNEHIDTITALCDTYYESNQKTVVKSRTAAKVLTIIQSFSKDPQLYVNLERRVNAENDNIMSRFRAQMINLSDQEYSIFLCSTLRMSVTAMQMIFNMNRNTFYTLRRRLRNKIVEIAPFDEEIFMKYLN